MLACLRVQIPSITSKYGGEEDHLPSGLPLTRFRTAISQISFSDKRNFKEGEGGEGETCIFDVIRNSFTLITFVL